MGTAFGRGLSGDDADGLPAHRPHLEALPRLQQRGFPRPDLVARCARGCCTSTTCRRSARRSRRARRPASCRRTTSSTATRRMSARCSARSATGPEQELLTCSDAWAPSNLVRSQHYFGDHAQAHAAALRAGLDSFTDQDADGEFTAAQVTEALERGLITSGDVDRAVRRKLLIRLRLGEFDPDGGPFATAAALDTPAHRELAAAAARRAAVLLKNDGLLPLAAAVSQSADDRRRRPARRHPLRGLVQPGAALPGHDLRRPRRGRRGRHRARGRRPGPHRPRRLRRLRLGRRHHHAAQ